MKIDEKLLELNLRRRKKEVLLIDKFKKGELDGSIFMAGLWCDYEYYGVEELFMNRNIVSAKQSFYLCGLFDEIRVLQYNSRFLDYGLIHVSYALLSDNQELILRYSNLRYKRAHNAELGMDEMVENGELPKPLLKWDLEFYKSIYHKDKGKAEEVLSELVSPKIHKRRNDDPILNNYLSHPAIGYAKLAWMNGLEVKIGSPLIPEILLPVKPNDVYEKKYDFL